MTKPFTILNNLEFLLRDLAPFSPLIKGGITLPRVNEKRVNTGERIRPFLG